MAVPNVRLNSGYDMPIIGLGTWGSPRGQVTEAVKVAIDAGYRHIDCAHVYQNEHEVGEGIHAKIDEGVIKRDDLFVTSKLWNTFHRPDLVRPALETTLANLKLSYLDMYLIHWPMAYKEGDDLFPKNADGNIIYSNIDYVSTWRALESVVEAGLVRSIGISNFNRRQIEQILSVAKIVPATNQVECHPYLSQQRLSEYCRSKGISITAYSPLGSPNRPWAKEGDPIILDDPRIVNIATRKQVTPAQILIRYQIQRGHIVIPKSVTRERIISNFQVFNFELNDSEMKEIETFECNGRLCPSLYDRDHPDHPFINDEY